MNQRYDVLGFGLAMLGFGLLAITGIYEPLFSDFVSKSIYEFVKDYQSTIAAVIALGAAIWAVRPVYSQLAEMRTQSAIQTFTTVKQAIAHIRSERRIAREMGSQDCSRLK